MKPKTLMVLGGCTLLLAGLFFEVRPAAAQSEEDCFRPEGVAEAPTPSITASEVEANPTSANLMTYALEAKNTSRARASTRTRWRIPLEFEGHCSRRRLVAKKLIFFSSCPFVVLRAPSWISFYPSCSFVD